jgi:DNA polymerase-3 subunit epsilon
MSTFAVVDLETTGFSPAKYHRIVEIGVVITDGDGSVEYEWSTLVNPHRDIGATPIHGVTASMVADAPSFADVAGDLSVLLDGRVLVAHNARFDVSFLQAEWLRLERDWNFNSLCTMQLARTRGLPGKLTACCEAIGIVNDEAHHALGDARVTSLLLAQLHPSADELPNPVQIPPVLPPWSGRALTRSATPKKADSGLVASLIARLPDASAHGLDVPAGTVESYRDALDRALEDRVLTAEEVDDLTNLAAEWGLTLEQIAQIHESFILGLVALAAADGVVTEAELTDLIRCSDLLGIPLHTLSGFIAEAPLASSMTAPGVQNDSAVETIADLAGCSVCFTGSSTCAVDGQLLSRSGQGVLAAAHGLTVCKGVTKKLDILVVADPDTESGKARKARDYGTRIMVERAFWEHLGIAVD